MKKRYIYLSFCLCLIPFLLGVSTCSPLRIDTSVLAAEAGQATMLLGGCQNSIGLGYESCWFERGAKLPPLQLAFMNPAEWAISDCDLGIYQTGKTDSPGVVEIDLERLTWQIMEAGFCILRVEAREYYPDNNDQNQMIEIPLVGGFFIEVFKKGYNPTPSSEMVGWCYEIRRTTSGRTTVGKCKK